MDLPEFQQLLSIGGQAATLSVGHAQVERLNLGSVRVDGRIYACDPFVPLDDQPFARRVIPGDYDVALLVAARRDQRDADVCLLEREVLAAVIQLSGNPPVSWAIAVRGAAHVGENAGSKDAAAAMAGIEDSGAYAVDSGTGCFMGWHAARYIVEGPTCSEPAREKLYAMYAACGSLGGVFGVEEHEAVAVFTSGSGDGVYKSWWGIDAQGAAAMLLTDFGTLTPAAEVDAAIQQRRKRAAKKWWQLWK